MLRFTIFILIFSTLIFSKNIGVVDFRLGELYLKNDSLSNWIDTIDEGDSIFLNDTLKTGSESKCEVLLVDKSLIRMGEKTIYTFKTYKNENNSVKCEGELLDGVVWSKVDTESGKRDFKIASPVAVAAVVGTIYKVEYGKNKKGVISVLEGRVNINPWVKRDKKSRSLKPKEIDGPKEVSLKDWVSIVKGEILIVDGWGNYEKKKIDISDLENEWKSFNKK